MIFITKIPGDTLLTKMPAELPSTEQIFTETSRLVPLLACPGAKRLGPKVLQDLSNDQFLFRCPILFVQWDARDSPRFKHDYFQMRDYFQMGRL